MKPRKPSPGDPSGFYHGMRVRWRAEAHVLVGPLASAVQRDLFMG